MAGGEAEEAGHPHAPTLVNGMLGSGQDGGADGRWNRLVG